MKTIGQGWRMLRRAVLAGAVLATAVTPALASQLTVMWNVNSDKEEKVLHDLLALYSAQHPTTTFKIEIVPYDSYDQKLAQVAASGTAPDLAKTTSMRPVIRPFLVDLAPAFGKDYLNQFVKSWASGARVGDQEIATPLDVTATGIFLNVDAFKRAGVAIPDAAQGWTWPQFLTAIHTVQQKAHIRFPLVWDVTPSRWIVYLYQNGQHIFSEQLPYKVVLDKAKGAKILDDFVKITEQDMPPGLWKGSSAENPKQLFLHGQAVAWMSGSWQVDSLTKDAPFAWQAGPTPHGAVRSSIVGGDYIIAFKGPHEKEALDVLRWFSTPAVQAKFAEPLMLIPASLKTGPVDYGNPKASAALAALQKELAVSPVYAGTDQGNEAMQYVWDPMKSALIQRVAGQINSAQAMDMIVKAADGALKAGGK